MTGPDYQEVLLQLLARWDLQLAKLQGRRPRSPERRRSRVVAKPDRAAARELTKMEYLNQRVEFAVEPLTNLLPDSDVRFIKTVLHDRLRSDPRLSALAEGVTRRLQPIET